MLCRRALLGAACFLAAIVWVPASGAFAENTPSSQTHPCMPPAAIEDSSGAVQRNQAALSASALCLWLQRFDEGPLHWRLLIVQNRAAPGRVFWVVPHDNEGDAFDSAVYGVRTYGGTIVAVKTGGKRMNGLQDPNRNFDVGTGRKCPRQVARSPLYTSKVLQGWDGSAPIIALHTNERGYQGDGKGGRGTISISRKTPGVVPFRAKAPVGVSPDDTIAYIASVRPPQANRRLMAFVTALNNKGINVAYEMVVPSRNDCSLSNYAALVGAPYYVNLEVMETDRETQRRMIDIVLGEMHLPPSAP